jgi:hypothetical protein
VSQADRAFYTLDSELRLVGASQNTLRIWGKSQKDIAGRKLTELFPFVDGGPVHAALLEALRTYRPVRLQTHSVLLSRTVDVEIYPVQDGLQVSFVPTTAEPKPS